MRIDFNSKYGVFTVKSENEEEKAQLKTSAVAICNLIIDFFDGEVQGNEGGEGMKRIPLKDTERYTLERFRQCKKTERHLAWLKSRKAGVGGSDMSTILGLNSFKTPYELWLEKTGRVEPEDISDKWAVIRGNALENELRKRFRANHPEMLVTDGTDKQFISREKPLLVEHSRRGRWTRLALPCVMRRLRCRKCSQADTRAATPMVADISSRSRHNSSRRLLQMTRGALRLESLISDA